MEKFEATETPNKGNYEVDNGFKIPKDYFQKISFFNFDRKKIKLSKKKFKKIFLEYLTCKSLGNFQGEEEVNKEKEKIKEFLKHLNITFADINQIKDEEIHELNQGALKDYFCGGNHSIYISADFIGKSKEFKTCVNEFKKKLKDCAKSNLRCREYLISTLKSINTSKTKNFNSEIKGLLNTQILKIINKSLQEDENDSEQNKYIIDKEADINNTTEQILKNIFKKLKIEKNEEEKEKIINKYQKSIDNLIEILYNFNYPYSQHCWNQEVSRNIIQKINTLEVEEWKDNLNLDEKNRENIENFFNIFFDDLFASDKELYSEYCDCLVSISSLFQMIGTKSDDFENNYEKVKKFINKKYIYIIPKDTSLINLYYETKVNEKGREEFFNNALKEIEKFETNNLEEDKSSLEICLDFCSNSNNKKNKKGLLDLITKEKLLKENVEDKEIIYRNAKELEIKNELSDIKEYLKKHNLSDKRLQSFITNFFNNGDKKSTIDILEYYIKKKNYDKALKYFSNFAGKNKLYFSFIDSFLLEEDKKTKENKENKEKAEIDSKENIEEEKDKFHSHDESKKSDKDDEVKQGGKHHHKHHHKKGEYHHGHHHKKGEYHHSHHHKHHKKSSNAETNQDEITVYELKSITKQGETQTSADKEDMLINAIITHNNKNEEFQLVKTPFKIKNRSFVYQERKIQSETANTQSRCPYTPKTKVEDLKNGTRTPLKPTKLSELFSTETPSQFLENKYRKRTESKVSTPPPNFDDSNNDGELDLKSENKITTRSAITTKDNNATPVKSEVQNKETSGLTRSYTIPIAENVAENNNLEPNPEIQKTKSAMPSTSLEKRSIEEIKKEIAEKIGDFFSKNSNNNKKEYNEKASEIRKDIANIVGEETKEQNLINKENEIIKEIYINFNNEKNKEDNLKKLLNNDYGKKLLNTEKRFTIEHFNEKYKNNSKQCKVKTQMDKNGITLLIEDYYENEIIIAKSNCASPMEILSEVAKYVINNNYDKNNNITIEKKEIKKEYSLFQEPKQRKPQSESKEQNNPFKTQEPNASKSRKLNRLETKELNEEAVSSRSEQLKA